MKLKLPIIIASLMYCLPNLAMKNQPTYPEMANKEIDLMAKNFKESFKLISDQPIDIYEAWAVNRVWPRYIRVDNSNHLKPLCDVKAVIEKHHMLTSAILASCLHLGLAGIEWNEHNHNGVPYMLPSYRQNNVLTRLDVDNILNEYAKPTPLTPQAHQILNEAIDHKIAAQEREKAARALKKVKQEQEVGLRPIGATRVQLLDNAAAAVEIDAQKKAHEGQTKKVAGATQNQQFSAAYISAVAHASPQINVQSHAKEINENPLAAAGISLPANGPSNEPTCDKK